NSIPSVPAGFSAEMVATGAACGKGPIKNYLNCKRPDYGTNVARARQIWQDLGDKAFPLSFQSPKLGAKSEDLPMGCALGTRLRRGFGQARGKRKCYRQSLRLTQIVRPAALRRLAACGTVARTL
ncbi:MAG: hypothetical protein ABIQ85_02555, partial [Cypionkella sp.]